ncbi:hypothetical protein PBI_SUZY_82 [Gordonia phage Suzy]|uniref:Uncharacterized protein n=1 Tax=Gordonia phage Suzy TaxID=2201430 RepID=A0A2Z4Q7X2_9CAUD|nr:hypothetical protein HOT44_gp82 [Gordonia phage Suzy]AWY06186.1 hypothetical protein PBI_SUZY_82 [Gordonia phage Suzy]
MSKDGHVPEICEDCGRDLGVALHEPGCDRGEGVPTYGSPRAFSDTFNQPMSEETRRAWGFAEGVAGVTPLRRENAITTPPASPPFGVAEYSSRRGMSRIGVARDGVSGKLRVVWLVKNTGELYLE